ncbi:MAG: hypothetical protein ACO1SX_01365 [Actinomycetota bacterium]
MSKLRQRYGLEVLTASAPFPVETQHGRIEGADAAPADVESYLRILGPEWCLYPPALIRRTGLRRIILCRDLSFAGQKRTAIPDFEHQDLYFDVARGRKNAEYVRKVIHHEYYHLIDWRDDGRLYADELWTALNAPGFRYGSGGANAQDDSRGSVLDDSLAGVLNRYSATGVEEDKAEVFANLLVSPVYVAERCRKDPVLHFKVQRMKLLMWRFVPELDLEFWSRAEQLVRTTH